MTEGSESWYLNRLKHNYIFIDNYIKYTKRDQWMVSLVASTFPYPYYNLKLAGQYLCSNSFVSKTLVII